MHGFSRLGIALVLGLVTTSGPSGQSRRVLVGLCAPLANVAAATSAGFDYIELGTSEIAALSDADFEEALAEIQRIGLPVPATNLFLPGSLKVTGPDVDPDAQMVYVRKAFGRLERLGVQVVVFGSGGARRVPEGFSQDEALRQLADFGRRAAIEAERHGITIAIEPLRRQESNIINSAADGLALVAAVDHPNFQLMIDYYHLSVEQEDPAIIARAGAHLRHLHMANPEGRVYPLDWTEYAYAPFFTALNAGGYDKRISVEARTEDFAHDAPLAIALLRRAFDR